VRTMIKDALGDFVLKGLDEADTSSFPLVLRDMELNAKRLNHECDPNGEQAIRLTAGTIGNVTVTPRWTGSIEVVASNIQLSFSFSATQAIRNSVKQAMRSNEDPDLAAALAASLDEQPLTQPSQLPAQLAQLPLEVPQQESQPQLRKQEYPEHQKPQEDPKEEGKHQPQGHRRQSIELAASSPCPQYCLAHDSSKKRTKVEELLTHQCKHCHGILQSNLKDVQYCQGCSCDLRKCMICGEDALGKKEETNSTNDILRHTPQHSSTQSAGLWLDIQAACDNKSNGIFDNFFGNMSSGRLFKACTDGSPGYSEEGIFPRVYAWAGA